MLSVENITRRHDSGFELAIPYWEASHGAVQAVLGTNGSGKSTLMRLLCSEQNPDQGSIRLHGRPLDEWNALDRARHLGVLPQVSSLDFGFSAREVVELGLTPLSLGWRKVAAAVDQVMTATDSLHLADKKYPRLSGGEKQRVHLARVLLQLSQAEQAPLLLLDEPTSAQDLGQQHRMLELLNTLATQQDYCVVAILHDLNLALRYTRDSLLLNDGKAVASGATRSVLSEHNIRRFWGYPARILQTEDGIPLVA